MKKVVAFLEKYAEWLALGVACLFLLFTIYTYIVSPDALKVKVGNEAMLPGEVDPYISKSPSMLPRVQSGMEATTSGLEDAFKVKNFSAEFKNAMGPDRPRMAAEYLASAQPFRPPLPGVEFQPETPTNERTKIAKLPIVPPPVPAKGISNGDSLVAPVIEIDPNDPDAVAAAQNVQPEDPQLALVNAIDKNWLTLEWSFDTKPLADSWKAVFFGPNKRLLPGVPPEVLMTHFLQLEVEREELIAPDQWGSKVTLQPLPLVKQAGYPKTGYPRIGDRQSEEEYRTWAETHQADIVEPAFYRILKGDPWYIPSMGQPKEKDAAVVLDQPFDPANPQIPFEKQTPQQRQQVYLYNQQKKAEQAKVEGEARKAKAAAAAAASKSPSSDRGGGGGGGGRRIGGYAPLPIQLAEGPTRQPGQQYDDGGRPIGPNRGGPLRPGDRPGVGGVPFRRGQGDYSDRRTPVNPAQPTDATPQFDQNNQVQNPVLMQPFDPSKLVDFKGNAPSIIMWAHDETAVPGKTYRYRARVKMKNPLHNTTSLAQDPKWETQLSIDSDWSPWKEVKAPPSTVYFFAGMRQGIQGAGATKQINSVTVDVFRHERGEWTKETFIVAPGDGIGGIKGKSDFSTGQMLIDLRPDTREKDLRIMISDEMGNIETISYETQKADPFYKTLLDKVNSSKPPAAGPGQPAASAGNPGNAALINEVGAR
jgi:hypothetical protein